KKISSPRTNTDFSTAVTLLKLSEYVLTVTSYELLFTIAPELVATSFRADKCRGDCGYPRSIGDKLRRSPARLPHKSQPGGGSKRTHARQPALHDWEYEGSRARPSGAASEDGRETATVRRRALVC